MARRRDPKTEKIRDMVKPARGEKLDKMLHAWLRDSLDAAWLNDRLRREDERVAQGKTPSDDLASIPPWLREAGLNTIFQMCERLIGSVKSRPMGVKVYARGGHDRNLLKIAGKRDTQIAAAVSATNLNYHVGRAVEDAVYSGQGFVRFGLEDAPGGRLNYKAFYSHWGGEIVDMLNVDDDTLAASQYHMSVRWMDMHQLAVMYPEHSKKLERMMQEGVGGPSQSRPADIRRRQYWYGNRSWIDEETEYGGGYGTAASRNRQGAVLGTAWWWEYEREGGRLATKRLMTAPFLTTPFADEVITLAEPIESLTGIIPVMQLLSGRYRDTGMPFPPVVRLPRGNERVMQYLLRGALFLMGRSLYMFTKEAVPTEGDDNTLMDPTKWLKMLKDADESPTRAIEVASLRAEHFQRISLSDEAKIAVEMLNFMRDVNQGMMPEHPSLRGDKTGVTAAAALREYANNAMLGHQKLLESWKLAYERFGMYSLEALRLAEDILPAGGVVTPDGRMNMRAADYDDVQVTLEELNAGQFGIAVRAEERKESDQYRASLKGEIVKMLSVMAPEVAPAVAMIAWKSEIPEDAVVDEIIEMMALMGYPVPESLMDPALRDKVAKMGDQKSRQEAELKKRALMRESAEIYKTLMQGAKASAESGKTAADAENEAMGVDGKPGGAGAGGVNDDERGKLLMAIQALRQAGGGMGNGA